MVIRKNSYSAILTYGTILKQVQTFNLFWLIITSDDRCEVDIHRRIAQAKAAFKNMKNILTNKNISLGVLRRAHINIMNVYPGHYVTAQQHTIETTEMCFYDE